MSTHYLVLIVDNLDVDDAHILSEYDDIYIWAAELFQAYLSPESGSDSRSVDDLTHEGRFQAEQQYVTQSQHNIIFSKSSARAW